MVIIILATIAFDIWLVIAATIGSEECMQMGLEDGRSSDDAQSTCDFMSGITKHKLTLLGVSGATILVCALVFYFKRD